MLQTALGIDITDCAVRLAYVKGGLKSSRILAAESYELDGNGSWHGHLDAIAAVIRNFMTSHKVAATSVCAGIGGRVVIFKRLTFPLVVKENLAETLRHEMEKHVPIPVEQVRFDYRVLGENKSRNQLTILLGIVKKADLDPVVNLAQRANISLSGIDVRPAAVANVLAAVGHGAAGDGCVHVFVDTAEIIIGVMNGAQLGDSRTLSSDQDAQAIADAILSLARAHYQESDNEKQPAPIYFIGPAGHPVAACLMAGEASPVAFVSAIDLGLTDLADMPAWGMALTGLAKIAIGFNLLPQRLRKRPSRVPVYMMFALATALLMGLIAWGGGMIMKQRMMIETLDRQLQELTAKTIAIAKIEEKIDDVESRLQFLLTPDARGGSTLDLLAELTGRIPETAWVRDLKFSEDGGQIDGYAQSAAELVPLLEASPVLSDVTFLSTITKGRDGNERFRIGFKTIPTKMDEQ